MKYEIEQNKEQEEEMKIKTRMGKWEEGIYIKKTRRKRQTRKMLGMTRYGYDQISPLCSSSPHDSIHWNTLATRNFYLLLYSFD